MTREPAFWFALGNLNMAAVWLVARWQERHDQRVAWRRRLKDL